MGRHLLPPRAPCWNSTAWVWCCLLALLLVAAPPLLPAWVSGQGSGAHGQDFSTIFDRSPGTGGGSGLFNLDSWLMKAFLIVVAFLAALLFFFLVIFRWMLTKKNPTWPLTAYGWCMTGVLTVAFSVALFLFWNDLVFGSGSLEVWGGRALLIGAWLFVVAIVLSVFRSPHARTPAKTAQA